MQLSYAVHRLLFKRPFGTAHGLRDGTDAVFVELQHGGHTGYGEATLPPYLTERPADVVAILKSIRITDLPDAAFAIDPVRHPAARAALTTAWYNLEASRQGVELKEVLGSRMAILPGDAVRSLITLGLTDPDRIVSELVELPGFNALKVKLDGVHDERILECVLKNDHRDLLIDANQGWDTVEHALRIIELAGERLLGIEQPFPVHRPELQKVLAMRTDAIIYGDESIQGLQDLGKASGMFRGVNIKLIKCGGLDVAKEMLARAREIDMKVMLGSMSESSLGCGAMLSLAGHVDLVDLDGPWLISNDPFAGLRIRDGQMVAGPGWPNTNGRFFEELHWTPIGT